MHRLLPLIALLTAGCQASPDPSPLVNGQVIDAVAMRQAMEDFADGARLPGLATCVFTVDATNWCDGVGLLDPTGADDNADTHFLDQTPGEAFAYSNMGSALAGWLVERATDTAFDAWTAQKLFTPLSLTNTSW